MKIAIGEIIDRYTICKLKQERGQIDCSKEIEDLHKELTEYPDINGYIEELYKLHGEIWDLESDIKSGNESILGLEEIGRRAIKLRDMNRVRISIKNDINTKFREGYIEIKRNHGSEQYPSVIISLTTVPERLSYPDDLGVKSVIESLCTQNDKDYEVHFNLPEVYNITKEPYIIPNWLEELKLKYRHLRVFRTEDMGPPTKFVPTLLRVTDPETIFIVVDDDQVYHPDMIIEHRKFQTRLPNCLICYEGRGTDNTVYSGDLRDSWIICVTFVRRTFMVQHYKSVSYKRKIFDEDFFKYYFGRTLSDDALVSKYCEDKGIKMFVVPYEPESHLYETFELWKKNERCETFPIVRGALMVAQTGCNHPELLKHPLGGRFYFPPTLGKRDFIGPAVIKEEDNIGSSKDYINSASDSSSEITVDNNLIQIIENTDKTEPKEIKIDLPDSLI